MNMRNYLYCILVVGACVCYSFANQNSQPPSPPLPQPVPVAVDHENQARNVPNVQLPPSSVSSVPWYENLPAVAMDYKVHIDPGKEDCYYQFVNRGATFYVSFQVIRGGDGMAGFTLRNPNGDIVHPYQWVTNTDYQDQESMGGYYMLCIDNQFSRFSDKLVSLYLTVVRYDEWEKYSKYVEDSMSNLNNFTNLIISVDHDINDAKQYLYHSKSREARDYSLLVYNNTMVLRWSLIHILIIVTTTVLQVVFVRRLFESKSRTRI